MPTQVTNYQCPACTGPLHFVGSSGKLECDYCGSKFDVAEIEALYAEKEQKAADTQKAAEEKQEKAAFSGYRLGHLRSFRRLGAGRSRYEELFLPVVRRGADL